ncbi:SIS domain-containing protein [Sediminibacterium sp. TEGAF015]|uniref:SIS domain-containing protein n=1 Tax=Sediminibacterium sp. TEGAF015 TaxID=575378 RepID=UPI0021FD61A9|nr:SIS domain-containing protein [Sediminibacterium sp. TEGAF015]BDQ13335.1 phosphoheptose isomerase [Sediminibacterium sp. TEGAF015]
MDFFFNDYKKDLIHAIESLDWKTMKEIADRIIELRNNGNIVYLIGNGGSSATPSHSAGDWTKELRIKTICLTDNTPSVTAFANDTDYTNIFKGQLETFLSKGDIVIGYSGSGNSPNVLNAIEFAKSKGNFTVGITGNYNDRNGGKLVSLADLSLVANTTSMERIEDVHLIINHIIKEYIKATINASQRISKV